MTEATTQTDLTAKKPLPHEASQKGDQHDTRADGKPDVPASLQETPGPAALKSQRDAINKKVDAKVEAQLPELQLTKPLDTAVAKKIQNDMLIQFAADVTPGSSGNTQKQQELVQNRIKNLEKERDNNEWGPESQKTFQDYVNWVQKFAIPNTVRDLSSSGVAMPPGYPAKIPTDGSGKVISDSDYAKQLQVSGGQVDLHVLTSDAPHAPNILDLQKLEAASDWTNRARSDITQKESNGLFAIDQKKIGAELPSTWALQPGGDSQQYKAALRVGSNLYEQLATAAIAVHALNQMGDSKLELPPGINVTDDGHGHLTPSVDMPARLGDLLNDPKTKQYLEWYEKNNPIITQDAATLKLGQKNPYTNLLYGNVELPGSLNPNGAKVSKQAVLDGQGRLVSIIDPTKETAPEPAPGADGKPATPYQKVDVDMIQQRFTAQAVDPNDRNSDVKVDISVQAQQGVPIGYDLLNKDIGTPLKIESRTYKADDMVLYNGKLVQARTLPERLSEDQLMYAGGKAFNIALDASMFVGGASALAKVAIEGGAKAVAEMAAKEAAATVSVGSSRAIVTGAAAETLAGAGGIFANNAWGHDYAPWVDEARTPYFAATGVAGISTRFQSMMSGGEAIQKVMQESGPAWLQTMSNVSEKTMSGLMPIMVGQIGASVGSRYYNLIKDAGHQDDANPLALSLLASSQLPEHTIFGADGKNNPPGGADKISLASMAQDYKSQLNTEAPGGKDVQGILDTAGKFDTLSDAEKTAAKKQWTDNLAFTGEDIKQLDKANNGKVTDQEIQDLMDPQKRAAMKESLRETAESIWANRNSDKFPEIAELRSLQATPELDVQTSLQLQDQIDKLQQKQTAYNANLQTASRMALLMTTRSADGTLPANIGAKTEKVDSHLATRWVYGLGMQLPLPEGIGERKVTENLSSQALLNGLRSDLTATDSVDGKKGTNLAVADLLARTGALAPQQYASIIEDKLAHGTADEKARILCTVEGSMTASVLDSLHQSEIRMQDPTLSADERSALQAENFGNSYDDLLKSLAKAASSDPDEKIRVMAAATYGGARKLASNLDETIAASQVLAAYQTLKSQEAADGKSADDLDGKIAKQQTTVTAAQEERKKIIDQMNSELEGARTDPKRALISIKNNLAADLNIPLPADDAAVSIEKRTNAAITLSLLNSPGTDGDATRELINTSLSEAFNRSERSQSLHMMDTLPPSMLQQLTADHGFADHLLDLIPTASQAESNVGMQENINLLTKVSQFAKDASPEFKNELQNKLNDLIGARSRLSLALPYTQAAAAKTANTLNAQGSLSALEDLARDINGSSPVAREAAVHALADMRDPKLKSLVPELLTKETDQQIHEQLLALNDKLDTNSIPSEFDNALAIDAANRFLDVATIAQRYPAIQNFDDAAQNKFLEDNNLDLLNHDTFENQAEIAVQQFYGAMVVYNLQEQIPRLIKKRDAQFANLVKLSQGDSSDPNTQMARLYMERIASSQGKPLVADSSVFAIPMHTGLGGDIKANYDEKTGTIGSIDVNNPRTPAITKETTAIPINKPRSVSWQDEAAITLARQALSGESGVDLDGYLIGNLLSNPTGLSDDSVGVLADAWHAMYAPDSSGRRVISPDRYKFALTRALETERLKQKARGANLTPGQKQSVEALDNKLRSMLLDLS